MSTTLFLPFIAKQRVDTPGWKGCAVASQFRKDDRYWNENAIRAMGITRYYAYVPNPPIAKGVEAITMTFGPEQIGESLRGTSWYHMGFNEPDLQGLACDDGARAWREMERAYPDKRLVSPGCFNLNWLKQMHAQYKFLYDGSPRFDVIAFHAYPQGHDWETGLREIKEKLRAAQAFARAIGTTEVWLTEFHYPPCFPLGPGETLQFIREFVPWARKQDLLTGIFWFVLAARCDEPWSFGSCTATLADFYTGELTERGIVYSGV